MVVVRGKILWTRKKIVKEIYCIIFTLISALLSAFALHIFVYPAEFAPSGIDGVSAMLQEITNLNAGLFSLLINLPLLLLAYFLLNKKYVIYTILFTIVSSIALVILANVGFYQYVTHTDRIIPAIFSGFILGIRTGIMLRLGASSGGIDVIAAMIQKKWFFKNIEKLITVICYVIIVLSYFVYKDVNSILLSIIQMFVFERSVAFLMRDTRNAVEFKIITKNPEQIKEEIIYNLKHGATILPSKGMYTGTDSSVIISVINNRQIGEFLNIIKKYPDTFVYYSDVAGVNGNFRWFKADETK